MNGERKQAEELFHDQWAESVDPASIDVVHVNESCTAPEIRWIVQQLGDLAGQRVLDFGCGLGDTSVYFALKGGKVTALDLSPRMLEHARALGHRYGVQLEVCAADAEHPTALGARTFDVIYSANMLHHVNIETTLKHLTPHLAPEGTLVTWDPLAYNPIINIYRRIAHRVRTPGEHPLTMADLRLFHDHFQNVEVRFFWLTTLVIFMVMAVVQRRSPNRVRYWKKVVEEGERWRWLYDPLEKLDRALLGLFPFLRPLCWNVCVLASKPRKLA